MVAAIPLRDKIFPFFILSVSAMIFSAAIMLFHDENSKKSGVLAGIIPGVETLQSSLGIIKKDLASIKKSTTEIEQTVKTNLEQTQRVAKKVDESTEQIIKSIEKLQKELSEDLTDESKEQISKSIAKLQKDLENLSENLSEVLSEEEQKRNEWKVSEIPAHYLDVKTMKKFGTIAKEPQNMKTETRMLESGKIIKDMEKEHIDMQMETNMLGNGKMMILMGKEL